MWRSWTRSKKHSLRTTSELDPGTPDARHAQESNFPRRSPKSLGPGSAQDSSPICRGHNCKTRLAGALGPYSSSAPQHVSVTTPFAEVLGRGRRGCSLLACGPVCRHTAEAACAPTYPGKRLTPCLAFRDEGPYKARSGSQNKPQQRQDLESEM